VVVHDDGANALRSIHRIGAKLRAATPPGQPPANRNVPATTTGSTGARALP
jgi:hypothetical protein